MPAKSAQRKAPMAMVARLKGALEKVKKLPPADRVDVLVRAGLVSKKDAKKVEGRFKQA